MKTYYDNVIVGGGFFGLYIAEYLSHCGNKVAVLEKEGDLMTRASYVNQARVHNGYHYPRSILTAMRSKESFPRFVSEFESCIDDRFSKYYMISNRLGKITPRQFEVFCNRIGLPCNSVNNSISKLVNPKMIQGVFSTTEYAFDSVKLKHLMKERLSEAGVDIYCQHNVYRIDKKSHTSKYLVIQGASDTKDFELSCRQVFNCTYSKINEILNSSNMEGIPLKHELTEMCIVDVPDELKNVGITVMCGPFFSLMPFPHKKLHSFSHVRYTPHTEWLESEGYSSSFHRKVDSMEKKSAWRKMIYDARRYIPILNDVVYKESIWENKTILPRSESDDSRPILFKANHGMEGLHTIMGGKIDNVYDAILTIKKLGLEK